jgi:6-pyruvoyltetrahydropterin/6-carboxytetrahydropterin synthase
MIETRRVSVERNRLRFSAAHMATFLGGCEPLHGHNYDVMVDIEGELTGDAWVWDFGELKTTTKAIIDQLDHKFLLQKQSTVLEIYEGKTNWKFRFGDRGYALPKSDVVALPIDNTTAERLAEWLATMLVAHYWEAGVTSFRKVTVGIEESPGQTGWYSVTL